MTVRPPVSVQIASGMRSLAGPTSALRVREPGDTRILSDGTPSPLPIPAQSPAAGCYLAMRSERYIEPVLFCPPPMATAYSAMKLPSVSPGRWEMTKLQPALRHRWMATISSQASSLLESFGVKPPSSRLYLPAAGGHPRRSETDASKLARGLPDCQQ